MRDEPIELHAEVLSERGPILRCRVAGHVVDIARTHPPQVLRRVRRPVAAERRTSTDMQHAVSRAAIEHLVLEGECLQDETPTRETAAAWIDRARASLTGVFGHGHRFVVDVQQAADGAAHPASDAGLTTARYLRVLILVVLSVLRRALFDLELYARP